MKSLLRRLSQRLRRAARRNTASPGNTAPPPPHPRPSSHPTHGPRPYDPPLVDSPSPLVRPYLIAHEQHMRRRELVLAALGQDGPGPYVIHGIEVA
ncbi:hypothetical protein [Streptomyces sp. NPDC002845]